MSGPHPCRVCGEPVLNREGLSSRVHRICRAKEQAKRYAKPARSVPAHKLIREPRQGSTVPNADVAKGVHRSEALRQSARDEACVSCGAQDGTVVWAHSNEGAHGKGKSLKAHDLLGLYLCFKCHAMYDSSRLPRLAKQMFFREHYPATMVRVAEKLAAGKLRL